jgi:hypothetical protein
MFCDTRLQSLNAGGGIVTPPGLRHAIAAAVDASEIASNADAPQAISRKR